MRQFLNFNSLLFQSYQTIKSLYKEFLNIITRSFPKERANLVSIDIGSSSIKIVEIGKKQNELVLEKYQLVPLPDACITGHHIDSYSILTEKLKDAITASGYANRDTAIVLSGPQVVIQLIKVPSGLADNQLAMHVELEAEKYLPFNTEEIALDFDVIDNGKKQKGHCEVLLAATKKSLIDEYINILKAANLNVKVMDIYSCVVGRLSKYVVSKQLQEDINDKVIAMIDIGHDILTVSICKNERQIYIKEQNFGGRVLNDLIQKEHAVDTKIASTLKFKHEDPAVLKLIETFNNQAVIQIYHMLQFFYASVSSEKIDYIFIFGGSANLPKLGSAIQERMGITVKVLDPFANINIERFHDDKVLLEIRTTLSLACGLALRSYVG